MLQLDKPQMAIRRMRITCWIPKVTNTLSEYGIHLAFLLQQWWDEPPSVLRYMYNASFEISELCCCQIYPNISFFNFELYELPVKEGRYGTVCPTRYRTRHFFNNSKINEDIATKFEQEYVRCLRNEDECVCSPFQISLQYPH